MVKNSKNIKVLTKEERLEQKRRNQFSKQIEEIFIFSGFESLPVKRKTFELGGRCNELDHAFIYENIIIICEDTIRLLKDNEARESKGVPVDRDHKLRKNETAEIIKNERKPFIEFLKSISQNNYLIKYAASEFKLYFLYFEYDLKKVSLQDKERYRNLTIVDNKTFQYFSLMSKCIKGSFKFEIFRYLNISRDDVGHPDPFGNSNICQIIAPIIYPDIITGFSDGVRMVSFMMKPADLIENSYVLRKDGWDEKTDLYQRLITPKRIKSIRMHVAKNKTTFLNNIIVTLPQSISFCIDSNGKSKQIALDSITSYSNKVKIQIPIDYNSMAIIDGQHRVFAYYEDTKKGDKVEEEISKLRNRLNLLVTGIIYPEDNELYKDDLEKRKFESNLFISINQNAQKVDADTLIQVKSIMDPTSGEALARKVLEILNSKGPFLEMFQLSKVEEGPIKTASIIQYALAKLLIPKNSKTSLYCYWLQNSGKPNTYKLRSSSDIYDYIQYASNALIEYFNAIKSKFIGYWNKDSKLLKIISMNAFIIAFRETLFLTNGPQKYTYYQEIFKNWIFSFQETSEAPFPYGGAQYSKFAKAEIIPLFEEYVRNRN